jgi:hypothetical protein
LGELANQVGIQQQEAEAKCDAAPLASEETKDINL